MDFRRPLAIVTPTLDGDVLALLAAGEVKLTGREISKRTGSSQEGVRRVLDRLVQQGIVLREHAGRAHLHALNRSHLAAPWIERLASLRQTLVQRLRGDVHAWSVPAVAVLLFGSVARGDAEQSSDIDVLVVRARSTPADDPAWRQQLVDLAANTTAMTGNDTRIVEYSVDEAIRLRDSDHLLASTSKEGIELVGSLARLPRRRRRRRGGGSSASRHGLGTVRSRSTPR